MLNPYAAYLGQRDPQVVIAATPHALDALAAKPATEPRPGKWSMREILCHLADCELVFAFRLRQSVAEEHHTIQPFDQDRWATTYAGYDLHSTLNTFRTLREWNIRFIAAQPPEVFSKLLTHPERGVMTFGTLVETM